MAPQNPPGDDPAPFDSDDAGLRARLQEDIPDLLRRTFFAGIGALFTTEEGIRKLANDFHLPKDVAAYLVTQAASSKDELFRIVAKELRGFLENANLSGELQKLLTSLSFEIKTEIRFIPNDEGVAGVKPQVKGDVTARREKKEKDPEKAREPGGE
jgi:hypothetical protein